MSVVSCLLLLLLLLCLLLCNFNPNTFCFMQLLLCDKRNQQSSDRHEGLLSSYLPSCLHITQNAIIVGRALTCSAWWRCSTDYTVCVCGCWTKGRIWKKDFWSLSPEYHIRYFFSRYRHSLALCMLFLVVVQIKVVFLRPCLLSH